MVDKSSGTLAIIKVFQDSKNSPDYPLKSRFFINFSEYRIWYRQAVTEY